MYPRAVEVHPLGSGCKIVALETLAIGIFKTKTIARINIYSNTPDNIRIQRADLLASKTKIKNALNGVLYITNQKNHYDKITELQLINK